MAAWRPPSGQAAPARPPVPEAQGFPGEERIGLPRHGLFSSRHGGGDWGHDGSRGGRPASRRNACRTARSPCRGPPGRARGAAAGAPLRTKRVRMAGLAGAAGMRTAGGPAGRDGEALARVPWPAARGRLAKRPKRARAPRRPGLQGQVWAAPCRRRPGRVWPGQDARHNVHPRSGGHGGQRRGRTRGLAAPWTGRHGLRPWQAWRRDWGDCRRGRQKGAEWAHAQCRQGWRQAGKKGPHRPARRHADSAGPGAAGLWGARPRAGPHARGGRPPNSPCRARETGFGGYAPWRIPGAAWRGAGKRRPREPWQARKNHAGRRARALPAPAAPGAHAALAGPPCGEDGDPGGLWHALGPCAARGDWAHQAPARGRLAGRGLQGRHQAHRRGRPALAGARPGRAGAARMVAPARQGVLAPDGRGPLCQAGRPGRGAGRPGHAPLATARAMGITPGGPETAIVPCEGKSGMSGAFHVHGHPGVPVCLAWDTDSGNDGRAGPRTSRGLQGPAGPESPGSQVWAAPFVPWCRPACGNNRAGRGHRGPLAARMGHYGPNPDRDGGKKKTAHSRQIVHGVPCAAKRGKNGLDSLPTVRILNWVARMRRGLDAQAPQDGFLGGQDPAQGAQDPPGRTLRAFLAAAHGAGREMPAPAARGQKSRPQKGSNPHRRGSHVACVSRLPVPCQRARQVTGGRGRLAGGRGRRLAVAGTPVPARPPTGPPCAPLGAFRVTGRRRRGEPAGKIPPA